MRSHDPDLPIRLVRASRGKTVRAEPIAATYEQGRVHHIRSERLAKLEEQMLEFTADFDPKVMGYSPDRVDVLVWALTELFPPLVRRERQDYALLGHAPKFADEW